MEIQYSTEGQLFGIVYRVGTVLQTNIPEEVEESNPIIDTDCRNLHCKEVLIFIFSPSF